MQKLYMIVNTSKMKQEMIIVKILKSSLDLNYFIALKEVK